MLVVPPRASFAVLTAAANAVVPTAIVGFVRSLDQSRVSVLYSYTYGIGEYLVENGDLPDVFSPSAEGPRHADAGAIDANAARPIEWHLLFAGVRRVISLPMASFDPAARFWVGLADPSPLTAQQIAGFEAVAETCAELLRATTPPDHDLAHLRRLELAARLLPALRRVLDVREVFDRLSTISRDPLPHDLLVLGLFNDDFTTVTMYARSGAGAELGRVFPNTYPAAFSRIWNFDIIDDLAAHPLERDRPPCKLGAHSALRLPITFDDRVIGGLGFNSFEVAKYTSADVAVGRRLADHVGVALSHHRLAGRLAEQARHNEELRARAQKSDLLDDILASITGTGALSEVFDQVSDLTQKVLAHDALVLIARLPDGQHGKVYASKTPAIAPLPDVLEVPPPMLANASWEFDVVTDLQAEPEQRHLTVARQGYRGVLRVPIRSDNEFVASLSFLSLTPARYTAADVPVAKRIADRVALSFARERGAVLLKRVDEATARAATLEARVRALTEELDARTGYRRVVGESAAWRQVLTQAAQVAATETTVLLLGESGTGKEVIARFLHRASARSGGPFIALNCAALPEQLLEAELFGYERGAYTGALQSKPGQLELAGGGTLFLDEVAEMSPSAQAKFLRVLQEREFQRLGGTRVLRTDARIVAATNRDLPRAIGQGLFREDLYYRLNVFAIRLPPLRERPGDVGPLSDVFVAEIGRGLGRPPAGISRDARKLLTEYPWPGNVRELRNILERAAILCDGGLITGEHLALNLAPAAAPVARIAEVPPIKIKEVTPVTRPEAPTVPGDLQALERSMIEQALQSARFNKSKAAKALDLTRQKLYLRMRKYGLE
jgi:transcriptional regulator with GAF, ATPase, and Fis domain